MKSNIESEKCQLLIKSVTLYVIPWKNIIKHMSNFKSKVHNKVINKQWILHGDIILIYTLQWFVENCSQRLVYKSAYLLNSKRNMTHKYCLCFYTQVSKTAHNNFSYLVNLKSLQDDSVIA